MIVNLYKLIEKKFKQNIEDETTLNLALDVLNQRENLEQENQKYKEVIDRLSKIIYEIDELRKNTGGYPTDYMDNLVNISNEVEHE